MIFFHDVNAKRKLKALFSLKYERRYHVSNLTLYLSSSSAKQMVSLSG